MLRIAREVPDAGVLAQEVPALKDCRPSPHRDPPETAIEAVTRFVDHVIG